MNPELRDLVKKALYFGGYYWLLGHLKRPRHHRLLIQMFHNVVTDEEKNQHWYNSDPPSAAELESTIVALKRRFRICTVAEAMTEIRCSGRLQRPTAALTFDDGYRSNYEIAFPLLKKHGIKATIYLPTDWIAGRMKLWWMELTLNLDHCELSKAKLDEIVQLCALQLPSACALQPNSPMTKIRLHEDLGNFLMRRNDAERSEILQKINRVLGTYNERAAVLDPPMTWEQIKEMADYGVEFGAHTCSHPNLSYLSDADAEFEIVESRRVIEEKLGSKVVGFAYPYGYDVEGYRRFEHVLKKHDFLYAATSWWGYVDQESEIYLLRRMMIPLSTSQALLGRSLGLEYRRNHWPMPEPPRAN